MRKTTLLVLAAALCACVRHRRARPDGGFFAV
jgi:hypothetical protein